jgi:hypothetical protein
MKAVKKERRNVVDNRADTAHVLARVHDVFVITSGMRPLDVEVCLYTRSCGD